MDTIDDLDAVMEVEEAEASGSDTAQKISLHLASKYTNSLLEDLLVLNEDFAELLWDIIVDGLQSRASEEQLLQQLNRRERRRLNLD